MFSDHATLNGRHVLHSCTEWQKNARDVRMPADKHAKDS